MTFDTSEEEEKDKEEKGEDAKDMKEEPELKKEDEVVNPTTSPDPSEPKK